eukprot:UN29199
MQTCRFFRDILRNEDLLKDFRLRYSMKEQSVCEPIISFKRSWNPLLKTTTNKNDGYLIPLLMYKYNRLEIKHEITSITNWKDFDRLT